MADNFRRFGGAVTTLKETVDTASTQLVVNYSATFPQNTPFDIVIDSEILTVRAIQIRLQLSDALLTVSRGQESTAATKHLQNRPVIPVLTKKAFVSLADDKEYSSVGPVSGTSITVQPVRGNGIFLIDPMVNEWRRFPANGDVLPPILSDGECADLFAHWNELAQETLYFMAIWSASNPRPGMSLRDGVKIRTDTSSTAPRRYIGTIQKQGIFFTTAAYRISLSVANNPTVRHEGFKVVRLNPTVTGVTVHGLQSARDGKSLVLSNISASQAVLLKHSSASALTNEKFLLPSKGDLTVPPGGGVVCVYDVVSRAWRIVNNCFVRSPRNNDPDLVQNALEDGLGNLLAYADGQADLILYQGN